MPLADPMYGIFGATPVDTMHAFRKGIIESLTVFIIDNLTPGQKTMLDHMVLDFEKRHSQTCRNEFPNLNLSSGITGLTKISASERVEVLFILVILANMDRGSAIFEAAFALNNNRRTVKDIIEVLEALLTFDAWLNKDNYWLLSKQQRAMNGIQHSIQSLLHLCRKCFAHHKWTFPKFHEMLHVVRDMERFGATKNFSAQRPKSLLIQAAKRPGRHVQKSQKGATYDMAAAERVVDSFLINRFSEHFQNNNTSLTNNDCGADTICNSTGRGTLGTITFNNDDDTYTIDWKTKTNQSHMTLPQELMEYVVGMFGNSVSICTEFKRDNLVFRCHPKFQSYLPKYDWMLIRFDTGVFPCRLSLVVITDDDFHLIVQSTIEKTNCRNGNGSVLFTEWTWSSDFLCCS